MMTTVVVVATLQPRPGERQFLIDAFATVAPRVHTEDEGCLLYALHDAGEPDGPLVIIEKWASAESLAEHGKSPAMLELGKAFAGRLAAAPVVLRTTPVSIAGSKGAI
jgi:quinol monooxygenase YgiN